ncbi:MAG: transposase [Candidatus Competibacterales bacterium]
MGFDGGKKVKGRKRHVMTDTQGLLIAVVVTAASVADRVGLVALLLLGWLSGDGSRVRRVFVDQGYRSHSLSQVIARVLNPHAPIVVEVAAPRARSGFQPEPQRWVVERTVAWLLNDRRRSKECEVCPENSQAMIELSIIRLLLRRLSRHDF